MVTDIMKKRKSIGRVYDRMGLNKAKALFLLIILLLISFVCLLSGCGSPSLEYYENQAWNFRLEYPKNWELNDNNRVANDFALQATKGLFRKSSARIHLYVELPFSREPPVELEADMENYITIVRKRTHIIKSLEVIQISDVIDIGSHKMIWATVSVPTLDIVEDASINQMGQRKENVSQVIDIYILRNSEGQNIVAEVYKGDDEDLNAQAAEIVRSIRFINE